MKSVLCFFIFCSLSLATVLGQNVILSGELGHIGYTPTTPRPEDVNCYVSVPTTTRVAGRCVPFGRGVYSIWTCQSGPHMQFTRACTPRYRRTRLAGSHNNN